MKKLSFGDHLSKLVSLFRFLLPIAGPDGLPVQFFILLGICLPEDGAARMDLLLRVQSVACSILQIELHIVPSFGFPSKWSNMPFACEVIARYNTSTLPLWILGPLGVKG